MRLQVDNEFRQVKIKNLNDENNVDMFTSSVRGGKAFAAEQKNKRTQNQGIEIEPSKVENQPFQNNSKFNIKHEPYEKCKIWSVS